MFQKSSSDLSRHTGVDEVETVVGPSVVVEGDFSSEGNILVKGTVCGSVKTGQLLTVEQGARILANVKAKSAIISGEVKGNVRVEERLELNESSRVLGDIACATLSIAPGALVQGRITMKGIQIEDKRDEKKRGTAKSKNTTSEEEEVEAAVEA